MSSQLEPYHSPSQACFQVSFARFHVSKVLCQIGHMRRRALGRFVQPKAVALYRVMTHSLLTVDLYAESILETNLCDNDGSCFS